MRIQAISKSVLFFSVLLCLLSWSCTHDSLETVLPVETQASKEFRISIEWTAFKFPLFDERVGVSGSFETFDYTLGTKSNDLFEQLDQAEISIQTSSVKVGENAEKTSNVAGHFFKYFSSDISGKIMSINEHEAIVKLSMNGISEEIFFSVYKDESIHQLNLKGKIENLDVFNASNALSKLDEQCGVYHQGFVWPDVDIEITVENYQLLN